MKHKDRKLDEKRMMHSMSLSLLGSSKACTGSRFHFSLVVGCGVLDIMKHFLQAVNLKKTHDSYGFGALKRCCLP